MSIEAILTQLKASMPDAILEARALQPNSVRIQVRPESVRRFVAKLVNGSTQVSVSAVSGIDLGDEIQLDYHFRINGRITTVGTKIPKENPVLESITDMIPGVAFFERENYDLLGVEFKGHPNLRRLLLPDDWPEKNYPLRKERMPMEKQESALAEHAPDSSTTTIEETAEGTLMNVIMGPQHPALLEPEKFTLKVEGELVVDVEPRIGYVHRGVEKAAERLMFFQDVHLVERICGICNMCHTTCFCQAVETILGVKAPPRAQYIRTIMLELNRIHSHLLLLGTFGLEIGYETLFQYMWRDREPIMDVIEAVSGNRVITAMNTIGGVRRDLQPKLVEKTKDTLEMIKQRMPFYKRLFLEDETLNARADGIGLLREEDALKLCTVGPVARGSGLETDIRVDEPYAAYGEIPFKMITYEEGDSLARLMVRVDEILESVSIIEYALNHLPSGQYRTRVPRVVEKGEAISRVEAPRGELFYYVKSNGTAYPERVKIRTPTFANILSFREIAKGCNVADVPAIFASLDPCFSCTDR